MILSLPALLIVIGVVLLTGRTDAKRTRERPTPRLDHICNVMGGAVTPREEEERTIGLFIADKQLKAAVQRVSA